MFPKTTHRVRSHDARPVARWRALVTGACGALALGVGLTLSTVRADADEVARLRVQEGDVASGPLVVTHPGVGTPPERGDGAQRAAEAAYAHLDSDDWSRR